MTVSDTDINVAPEISQFLASPRKMLINGQWADAASGKTFPVYNPATGKVMAHVAEGDKEDIDRAVKAARSAFDDGPWRKTMTPSLRGRLINKLADLLEQHTEAFAQLESLDNGKPLTVARVADLPLAIDLFRYMAGWATKIEDNTIPLSTPGQYFAYTLCEPIGVVGQIIPWNFPPLMVALDDGRSRWRPLSERNVQMSGWFLHRGLWGSGCAGVRGKLFACHLSVPTDSRERRLAPFERKESRV
ncbi:aldehyde dehydrogenase family protein [Ktedonosporobacter rubrisoli]|uniref:Aldehyde dehydrogenase family protein n=1 Tax=Ktedonosporobacter rubrisoli TaxID=2509675 RepID=A0A4P6JML2_KTERU|nr:aldehyde dehydrogenase family protein [Ktedonosporobacter rubrisoli]QBD76499.1 aldehyde dehydrogenase family protein [Ktedonosporobacter rubrisoli]